MEELPCNSELNSRPVASVVDAQNEGVTPVTAPGRTGISQMLERPLLAEGPLPKVVVIDLDQTLWGFDAAQPKYATPHRRLDKNRVQCSGGAVASPFPEAVACLQTLFQVDREGQSLRVAVASMNSRREVCLSLLNKFGLMAYASLPGIDPAMVQIHKGNKRQHLTALAHAGGVSFTDMLFFDDFSVNISTGRKLGVVSCKVLPHEGLTFLALEKGIKAWREQQQSQCVPAAETAQITRSDRQQATEDANSLPLSEIGGLADEKQLFNS